MSPRNAPVGANESAARDERGPAPAPTEQPAVQATAPTPPAAPAQPAPEHPVSLGALYGALWHHAAGARHLLLFAFVLLLTSQLFKLAVPWLAGNAINLIQAGGL